MAVLEESEKQETVRLLYEFATQQAEDGANPAQIERALVERGLNPEAARIITQNVTNVLAQTDRLNFEAPAYELLQNQTAFDLRRQANREILWGLAFVGLGLLFIALSYMVSKGQIFSPFYLMLIIGLLLVGRGYVRLLQAQRIEEL